MIAGLLLALASTDSCDGCSLVGKSVTLQIVRKKQKMDVAVTIAEVPDETARRPGPPPKP